MEKMEEGGEEEEEKEEGIDGKVGREVDILVKIGRFVS